MFSEPSRYKRQSKAALYPKNDEINFSRRLSFREDIIRINQGFSDSDCTHRPWVSLYRRTVRGIPNSKSAEEQNNFYASKLTNLMNLLETIHSVPTKRSKTTGKFHFWICILFVTNRGNWWHGWFRWRRKLTQRLKVMEGNLVLECNNYMHPLLEVRTQSTSDRDSEVATKDRDS